MPGKTIVEVKAREILDSKARPTVEVDVRTADGVLGRGSSPCGTSVGSHEAFVLRDGGDRYRGLGVRRAVRNVTEAIAPSLVGRSVADYREIDALLIELDGTPDKSRLGANAIYSVSIAAARAGAAACDLPLYRYLGAPAESTIPVPMFNMINGGRPNGAAMAIQEFLVIPATAGCYAEALQMGVEIFAALGEVIQGRYGSGAASIGTCAGYRAPAGDPEELLDVLLEAAHQAGYGGKCRLGLDCAASEFFDSVTGRYQFCGESLDCEGMIGVLERLAKAYDLFVIEDPLEENDFEGFASITRRVPAIVVGDDLFAANLERIKRGAAMGAANAMILKPNMVGTISEAISSARYAQEQGYRVIGSGRAGGTIDDPITDIAVAVGVPLVKFGAPRTGERLAKHNVVLRMEEELGAAARFAGPSVFAESRRDPILHGSCS
ncbi:MAG TPA: enolase C-terminal domain-like protein [Bryobacteraceae bacterium]|nr:enolase C-terminal domain-like protein [Bryobacteraceae bacterium]